MQRARIGFDEKDVKDYYEAFFCHYHRRRSAVKHQIRSLLKPLDHARLYIDIACEVGTLERQAPFVVELRKALLEVQTRIRYLETNFPASGELCKNYVDSMHLFSGYLPPDMPFDFGRPALRECDNAVQIANAMFLPEPADNYTIQRLRPYHEGFYPEMFGMRRKYERPAVSV